MTHKQMFAGLGMFVLGCALSVAMDLSIPHTHDSGWMSNTPIPPPHAPYWNCFDAQVYVPTPLGTILQGDQQVCIGPMTGPSKKGSTL